MTEDFITRIQGTLSEIKEAGLWKPEVALAGPQGSHVLLSGGRKVINLCSNNYLGLSNHPAMLRAAHEALNQWGYGLSSVRFICGTQDVHRELERRLSAFLGTEDTILYSSCFDANAGLFETLLGPDDAVISDELNHASIIDGIRLCKARRFRYRNADPADLDAKLKEAAAAGCKNMLIATDGVFSMDGTFAPLPEICTAARRRGAWVMVDDSHAVGFIGRTGRGTPEHFDVVQSVDILTGTLGKALGGASGGYVSGRKEVVELLRQRSRPYLFSNSLAPMIAATSLAALDLVEKSTELRDRLKSNAKTFRGILTSSGLTLKPGIHPIAPVMLGDAELAQKFATRMLEKGVYVAGFSYPVVPHGTARIRTQVSAAHSEDDIRLAADAFAEVKAELCP